LGTGNSLHCALSAAYYQRSLTLFDELDVLVIDITPVLRNTNSLGLPARCSSLLHSFSSLFHASPARALSRSQEGPSRALPTLAGFAAVRVLAAVLTAAPWGKNS
jgi:hypothetical protein